MANVFAPYGFLPVTSATGAPSNYEMASGVIAYNDTTKIFRGDPVKLLSTGFISQWTAGTAVSQLAGIFWGCTYLSSAQGKQVESQYWPGADVASTNQGTINAWIIPCTGAAAPTFRVQAANSSTTDTTGIAFADIGQTIDVALGAGNTFNGQSTAYIDLNTINTTATLPFRVVSLFGGGLGQGGVGGIQPGTNGPYAGSATGAFNWVIVRANVSGAGATGI